MAKRKFTAMVTPNTFGISKRSHLAKPPQEVARNQNMRNKMERAN